MDIITGQFIMNCSTYTGVGKTDGCRYYVIFIMVDISEVLCGARNDKSPEAVACTLEPSPGQRRDSL